jgi:hypothetical protein
MFLNYKKIKHKIKIYFYIKKIKKENKNRKFIY